VDELLGGGGGGGEIRVGEVKQGCIIMKDCYFQGKKNTDGYSDRNP